MSDTPDLPKGDNPIDPVEPADSSDSADTTHVANGNGLKNGKNGAHALDKAKNGNGNGNGKHAVDPPKEDGADNVKETNGKNGSFFSDKRFQIGILATLVIASLGVWWVIFQEVSSDNVPDLPAPAGEFDPNLVTESTEQESEPAVEPETSIPNEATSDTRVAAESGATDDSELVIDEGSNVTADLELRERGFFDAIDHE